MKKQFSLLFLILIVVAACNKQQKQNNKNSFAPKVVEAKGYVVSQDSIQQPKTISAGIPITIIAGNPKVTLTNTNIHPVGKPTVIKTVVDNIIVHF